MIMQRQLAELWTCQHQLLISGFNPKQSCCSRSLVSQLSEPPAWTGMEPIVTSTQSGSSNLSRKVFVCCRAMSAGAATAEKDMS